METQLPVQSIENWIKQNREALVEDIRGLVGIDSTAAPPAPGKPFGEGCADALDYMLSLGERMGFLPQNYDYYAGSLLHGDAEETIGILAHLDVVPAGGGWQSDPFQMQEKDGYLIGRGVADDKGPAVMGLYAMKCIRELHLPMRRGIRLILGCNEETGMQDLPYFLAHEKPPVFTFTPDSAFPVCNGEKGICELELLSPPLSGAIVDFSGGTASNVVADSACVLLQNTDLTQAQALAERTIGIRAQAEGPYVKITAAGIAAHASTPENAVSAIGRAVSFLLRGGFVSREEEQVLRFLAEILQTHDGRALDIDFSDRLSGPLTCISGLVSMRESRLALNLNIRYPVSTDGAFLLRCVRTACAPHGFSMALLNHNKPLYLPAGHPAVQALTACYNEATGAGSAPYVTGGGTYARHMPNCVAFGCEFPGHASPYGAGRGGFHQPDECLSVDDLLLSLKIYIFALLRMDEAALSSV